MRSRNRGGRGVGPCRNVALLGRFFHTGLDDCEKTVIFEINLLNLKSPITEMKNRKLRMGMIGGGSDAFIGAIHRRAALMENEIELVCGCFSVNPEISISSGRSYYVPDNRIYTTWEEMLDRGGRSA